MDFDSFLDQAWTDHGKEPQEVAKRLPMAFGLITKEDQIGYLAHLMQHVMGEHLGEWQKGIQFLEELRLLPFYVREGDTESGLKRNIAALRLASGEAEALLHDFSTSDQIRILAVASSALVGQSQLVRARLLFNHALSLAEKLLSENQKDPAFRSLAITGNNMACAFEEKSDLHFDEIEMMLVAAHAGRKYWEIAGGWLETARAEYRLSKSHLKAKLFDGSLNHAQLYLDLCVKNQAEAGDLFSAFEASAAALKAMGKAVEFAEAKTQATNHFARIPEADQAWYRKDFEALNS